MSLNLEKQLQFYGAYHHNPVNVAIHLTCVPLILWTAFVLLTNTPSVPLPDGFQIPNLPINGGFIACSIYAIFYLLLEPVAGAMITPLLYGSLALGNHLTSTYGKTANYWALGLHVVSWLAQFVGHGVFEGRAPALLDNLVQAIFLAPFFVFLEVLFFFGYRPELKSRLDKAISADIKKYKESKANGKVNGKAQNGGAK